MRKKYKVIIDQLLRDNIANSRTTIVMECERVRKTSNSGSSFQHFTRIIDREIIKALSQIIDTILESKKLKFKYSKSNVKYLNERLLDLYVKEVDRMYYSEIELKNDIQMNKSQQEINMNVLKGNIRSLIVSEVKKDDFVQHRKVKDTSKRKERKEDVKWIIGTLITVVGIVVTVLIAT